MRSTFAACFALHFAALAGVLACCATATAQPNDQGLQEIRARQEQFRVKALEALNEGEAALLHEDPHAAAVCYARAVALYPVSLERQKREQSQPHFLRNDGIELEERDQNYQSTVDKLDEVYERLRAAADTAHRKSLELEEQRDYRGSLSWELEARKGVGYSTGGWCGTCNLISEQQRESRLILLQFKAGRAADAIASARKLFFSERLCEYSYSPEVVTRFVDEESQRLKLAAIEAEFDQFAAKRLRERADDPRVVAANGQTGATFAVKQYIAVRRAALAGDKAALWGLVTGQGAMPSVAHAHEGHWIQHRAAVELERLPGVPPFVERQMGRSSLDRAWGLLVLARLAPNTALAKADAVLQAPDTSAAAAKECFYALMFVGGEDAARILRRYRIPGHAWTVTLEEVERIWNTPNGW